MRYPIECQNIIDVTKPPYNADNTGKTDCTKILCKIFDDVMIREIEGVKETYEKLMKMSDNGVKTVYDGFENRVYNETCEEVGVNVIYPEFVPPARIIYFPAGTYLVSDSITYSFKNLHNIYLSEPFSELIRGIHFMGESRESVTIRLADNSKGFEKGSSKPVLNLVNVPGCLEKGCTNVSQLNTVEDMTIDCGSGNEGAVGLRFMSINSGKIANISVKADDAYCGIQTARGATARMNNIEVSGCRYGLVLRYCSVTVLDKIMVSENSVAGILTRSASIACNNIVSGNIPAFEFEDETEDECFRGNYYFADDFTVKDNKTYKNVIFREKTDLLTREIPENVRSTDKNDWVCVDDFGAAGDGVTDCTDAIQKAFNSGKEVIIFGDGHYFVNGAITIPKTVKTIDFMFCDLFSGEKLINGEVDALFVINEDSSDVLFMENLYTFEQFYGHMRLIKHASKRDLVMSDIHTQASASYFNTVAGSRVYLDNCASTVGTYSYNCILRREGNDENFCEEIPYEFHGQTVYGAQVNPERADIELLNDNSVIMLDAYKVEGPGTSVKTINGGKTQVNVGSCGIGYTYADNALFETEDSHLVLSGIRILDVGDYLCYNKIIKTSKNGEEHEISSGELKEVISPLKRNINRYDSDDINSLS